MASYSTSPKTSRSQEMLKQTKSNPRTSLNVWTGSSTLRTPSLTRSSARATKRWSRALKASAKTCTRKPTHSMSARTPSPRAFNTPLSSGGRKMHPSWTTPRDLNTFKLSLLAHGYSKRCPERLQLLMKSRSQRLTISWPSYHHLLYGTNLWKSQTEGPSSLEN